MASSAQNLATATQDGALPSLIGASPQMDDLRLRVEKASQVQRTTLIAGPTGVGKELVARNLHFRSDRRDRPFVTIDCGALPEHLVESELFGHRRGSFTGATQARDGLVRAAAGGTLFLDEVNSLPVEAQGKLLRFLEANEYRAVGSDRIEHTDAWVIAASNRELSEEVDSGRFRSDLRYRLEVIRIDVPELRDRGNDVLLLAEHFLEGVSGEHFLTASAKRSLLQYSWPGNIRELKHRLESAALFCDDGRITSDALGLEDDPDADLSILEGDGLQDQLWSLVENQGLTLGEAISLCERLLIRQALQSEDDNRTRAAARLGIHVRTIFKKLSRD